MRRLSEILAEGKKAVVEAPAIPVPESDWQSLVLFDNVLDGERLLSLPEIQKLLIYFFGHPRISLVETNYPEELHDFLIDVVYKADVKGLAMVYPVKASFEEMAIPGHSEEYSGPLYIQIIHPDQMENDLLVLTCRWTDNLFHNDSYIIGLIADSDDLITIVDEYLRRD